jgi:hypothetical protein
MIRSEARKIIAAQKQKEYFALLTNAEKHIPAIQNIFLSENEKDIQ